MLFARPCGRCPGSPRRSSAAAPQLSRPPCRRTD